MEWRSRGRASPRKSAKASLGRRLEQSHGGRREGPAMVQGKWRD